MNTKIISLTPLFSKFRFRISAGKVEVLASDEMKSPIHLNYLNLDGYCLIVNDNTRTAINIINFLHLKAKKEKSPVLKEFWQSLISPPLENILLVGAHIKNPNRYQLISLHLADEDSPLSNIRGLQRDERNNFSFLEKLPNGIFFLRGKDMDEKSAILTRGILECLKEYDPTVTYPKR